MNLGVRNSSGRTSITKQKKSGPIVMKCPQDVSWNIFSLGLTLFLGSKVHWAKQSPAFCFLLEFCGFDCFHKSLGAMISLVLSSPRAGIRSGFVCLNLHFHDTSEFIYRTETDLENDLMVTRGEGWSGGIIREFGMDMYTLLYLK